MKIYCSVKKETKKKSSKYRDKKMNARLSRWEYKSLPEAANYLGLSRSQLYWLTRKHKIIHSKPLGNSICYKKKDLDTFISRGIVEERRSNKKCYN